MTAHQILALCGSLGARSSNAAALDVIEDVLASHDDITVTRWGSVAAIPIFDPSAAEPSAIADQWLSAAGSCDALVVAAPEYAGSLAGGVKNALDWLVGSAGLYGKPVAIVSCGTTGGRFAREELHRTLTWQGAFVVTALGVSAPRTKTDADGRFADAATIDELDRVAQQLYASLSMTPDERGTLAASTRRGILAEQIVGPTAV
jgi:chromate reductase, NAD(P)H dehydrogenase (quinone)